MEGFGYVHKGDGCGHGQGAGEPQRGRQQQMDCDPDQSRQDMLSTLFFLPVAGKLRSRTLNEVLQLEIIFEGAKCILENNNPRLVSEKLSSFVAPKERRYERR